MFSATPLPEWFLVVRHTHTASSNSRHRTNTSNQFILFTLPLSQLYFYLCNCCIFNTSWLFQYAFSNIIFRISSPPPTPPLLFVYLNCLSPTHFRLFFFIAVCTHFRLSMDVSTCPIEYKFSMDTKVGGYLLHYHSRTNPAKIFVHIRSKCQLCLFRLRRC